MKSFVFCAAACLLLAGCSSSYEQREPIELPPLTPLSIEEWKSITDLNQKYEPTTLDRLRLHDEQLQNETRWGMFMRQVVIPERKKDIPLAGQTPAS